jgi:hypothetical protein
VRKRFMILHICIVFLSMGLAKADIIIKNGPSSIPCFNVYEIIVQLDLPCEGNPFTDFKVSATFIPDGGSPIEIDGFCDDQKGRCFRIRFCPSLAETEYRFSLKTSNDSDKKYTGTFVTTKPTRMEPVVVNPENPKHFEFALSRQPFYHMGLTAYHLLDTSNSEQQIEKLLNYCIKYGFNKVRFLLTGYPRDTDSRKKNEYTLQGDPWKLPNYGAPPGEVNPLPAWLGKPHKYDFTRFNVSYWQKVDNVLRAMKERGIIATCIITIEKQNLPNEYGTLTEFGGI